MTKEVAMAKIVARQVARAVAETRIKSSFSGCYEN